MQFKLTFFAYLIGAGEKIYSRINCDLVWFASIHKFEKSIF